MKYRVIVAADVSDLEKQVNEALEHGWELQGGVSLQEYIETWENPREGCKESEKNTTYLQAIIKG